MSLDSEIARAAREAPQEDPMKVARRLLARLKRNELVEMLADDIAHEQRALARGVELTAFGAFDADKLIALARRHPNEVAQAFRPLFRERFKLGDGKEVDWAEATVEQHQQRIAMLEKIQAGIGATIDRHRAAIAACEAAGVDRLADLDAAA